MNKYLEQVNTGLRINSSADDSSGLAIANQLRSQYNGLTQAIKNSNEGIGLVKIADSALEEYTKLLMDARDKASQAVSDSNSAEARTALENDVKLLLEQANNIATQTTYNGISLLDGTFSNKKFQTGAYSGQTTSISIGDAKTATLGIDDASIDLTTGAGAEAAITSLDSAITTLDWIRSNIVSVQLSFESNVRNLETTRVNIKAAESNIREVDLTEAQAKASEWSIKNQAAMYAFQLGQQVQQNVLSLLR